MESVQNERGALLVQVRELEMAVRQKDAALVTANAARTEADAATTAVQDDLLALQSEHVSERMASSKLAMEVTGE